MDRSKRHKKKEERPDKASLRLAKAIHQEFKRDEFSLRSRSKKKVKQDSASAYAGESSTSSESFSDDLDDVHLSESESESEIPSNTATSSQLGQLSSVNPISNTTPSGRPLHINMATGLYCSYPAATQTLAYHRFCGRLLDSEKTELYLASYTVERWISDTESRCISKGITEDHAKIAEANLGVHGTKGDANIVLTSKYMRSCINWATFKKKAYNYWKPKQARDNLE